MFPAVLHLIILVLVNNNNKLIASLHGARDFENAPAATGAIRVIRPSTSIHPTIEASSCGGTFEPLFPAAEDHYYVNSGRLWCSCTRQLASGGWRELICDVTRQISFRTHFFFGSKSPMRILWFERLSQKTIRKIRAHSSLKSPDGHVPPKYHGNRAINFIVGLLW